ncbi:MAG: hypothetical protein Q9176_008110 [Flavoplaca citrina]
MFPSAIWRPLVVSFTIAVILVYSWIGKIARPPGPDVATWPNQDISSQPNTLQPIPRKIWQLWIGRPIPEDVQRSIKSWTDKNPSHAHTVLDDQDGREFVRQHYSHDPYVMNTYLELGESILRLDYLRYLVMAAHGGIYTDTDTTAVRPIDSWLDGHSDKSVGAMIGLEFDMLQNTELPSGIFMPLQFCQWSFASSAHHPLMNRVVQAVTRELHDLALTTGVSLSELRPRNNQDVLFATGPVRWSREIFAYLSYITGTEMTHRNFTGITEPVLVGDVLILPIKAFAVGMRSSGGGVDIVNETLALHGFRGSWKMRGGQMPKGLDMGDKGGKRRRGNEGAGEEQGKWKEEDAG